MGVVRRVVEEIWNQGLLDVADTIFAPDYVNHGGLIPDLTLGPESIKVSVALFRAAFPALHVSVESLAAEGDGVMLAWTAHSAPPTIAALGPTGTLPGTTRFRFDGERIVESWMTWDEVGVLRRLGLVGSLIPERRD